ncbi:MAG: ABC1 kinase family protein [Pseudomonadota bacterium]
MARDRDNDNKNERRFTATTPTRRFLKLAGMSTSIATRVATSATKSLFLSEEEREKERQKMLAKIGSEVAQTLGEMKGAVMKVGQIASQIKDLLPEEFAKALEKLQKESPPMPFRVIRKQMIDELGAPPYELFREMDEEPFAAASIGQVHRAVLHDGREVVIKVQYPGVEESIESDLKHLRRILKLAGLLKVEERVIDEIFQEIRDRLHDELNYVQEAENLRRFREFHAADEGIVIPQVVDEFTRRRVLTLTLETGDSLETVATSAAYPQELRDRIGRRLFDLFGKQIFVHRAVHCDPHPGNFAFRPDGSIVIYDFGAVKDIEPDVIVALRKIMNATYARDYAQIDEGLKAIGVRKIDGPRPEDEFYERWIRLFLPAFDSEPFDFGKSRMHFDVVKQARATPLRYLDSFQPSARVMLIDRVLSGHYWTLMKLGTVAAMRDLTDKYTREAA